ncbi:MAG: hypothetical protein IPK53_01155 [bacterium]|nr:hypothetical protein [bacterium]
MGKSFDHCDVVLVEGNLGRYRNLSLGNRLDENQIAGIVSSQAGFQVDGGLHARGGRDSEMMFTEDGVTITSAKRSDGST